MTTAKSVGGDERSGRWVGMNQTECGMHEHIQKVKQLASADGSEPTLRCDACFDVDKSSFEEEVVLSKMDVLIELYSQYCVHCKHFAQEFEKLARALQSVLPLRVARMDAVHNEVPKHLNVKGSFQIQGFPTIFLSRVGAKAAPEQYSGDKTASALMRWLKSKLGYLALVPDI